MAMPALPISMTNESDTARPSSPGASVVRDGVVDEQIAFGQLQLFERALEAALPLTRIRPRHRQRQIAFVEFILLAGARDLRVAQRERSQPEIVLRAHADRDARGVVAEQQILAGREDVDGGRLIGRHRHRNQPRRFRCGGDAEHARFRQQQLGLKLARADGAAAPTRAVAAAVAGVAARCRRRCGVAVCARSLKVICVLPDATSI